MIDETKSDSDSDIELSPSVEDDLTADMDDPAPENPVSEVKLTAANAGRADMQPSKPAEEKCPSCDYYAKPATVRQGYNKV